MQRTIARRKQNGQSLKSEEPKQRNSQDSVEKEQLKNDEQELSSLISEIKSLEVKKKTLENSCDKLEDEYKTLDADLNLLNNEIDISTNDREISQLKQGIMITKSKMYELDRKIDVIIYRIKRLDFIIDEKKKRKMQIKENLRDKY